MGDWPAEVFTVEGVDEGSMPLGLCVPVVVDSLDVKV